ncbi:MAG: molybdopterin molybdotransferase [Thermoleophilaceae bacterium]|nr:molybdopterin molybdotransferase [Thermoleophilaceae bacterium]
MLATEKMRRMADLIAIAEARRRVLEAVRTLPAEQLGLMQALGRVLTENVESPIDVPPFDSSAMDGYAVIGGPAAELEVVAEARAGHPAGVPVRPGTAIEISTGAAVPEGATAVVPVEDTEPGAAPDTVRVPATVGGTNIRRAGEDVRAGEAVLPSGTPLGPAELGVAASVGRGSLACAGRPRVALLVTGDELTEPGEPLEPGRIYSSNGYALMGQAVRAGAELIGRERVPDTAEATRAALGRALDVANVVVVSGGVSVGPHDHVKAALAALGAEQRFWGVSLRPGKPVWFGTRGETLAFGLPGNPVSAMVTFQLFVRPALAALQGADPSATRTTAVLEQPIARNPRREQAVRVRLRAADGGWVASPTSGAQGSHVLTSMLGADALALIGPGDGEAPAGERVEMELL